MTLQTTVFLAAALGMLTACGPTISTTITTDERPVDITFGRTPEGAPPLARPSDADPLPQSTFPGFIAAPVPLGGSQPPPTFEPRPVPDGPSFPPGTVDASPSCPVSSEGQMPGSFAERDVDRPPRPGVLRYRRDGVLRTSRSSYADAEAQDGTPLPPVVLREVLDVVQGVDPTRPEAFEYDVRQVEETLETTTTYRVAPGDGVFIARVVTVDEGLNSSPGQPPDTETFNPQPPVRILNLPLAIDQQVGSPSTAEQSGRGVDPLTGMFVENFFTNTGKVTVDVCGDLVEGWSIRIESGQLQRPGVRQYAFEGSFVFAPQLGGIVIAEDITFFQGTNLYQGQFFRLDQASTLTELPEDVK